MGSDYRSGESGLQSRVIGSDGEKDGKRYVHATERKGDLPHGVSQPLAADSVCVCWVGAFFFSG